jgi:hypothetical protein
MTNKISYTKVFNQLHKDINTNKADQLKAREKYGAIADRLVSIYKDKKMQVAYAEYVTEYAKGKADSDKSIKLIQNNLGAKGTQRKMLGLEPKDELTHKIRFMTANKTLLDDGLCTPAQKENKQFLWVVTEVSDSDKPTFAKDLQKLINRYNITKVETEKAVKGINFG